VQLPAESVCAVFQPILATGSACRLSADGHAIGVSDSDVLRGVRIVVQFSSHPGLRSDSRLCGKEPFMVMSIGLCILSAGIGVIPSRLSAHHSFYGIIFQ
jgi:hypothetical protein